MPEIQERRILVAEDDPLCRSVFVRILSTAGYRVEAYSTGAEVLAAVQASPDSVLLLDHQLPDMSAQMIITQLACSGIKVPFIVVTGQGNERLAADMMKLGAIDYLVKDNVLYEILPEVVNRAFRTIETERLLHAAEIALRENERRFRHVLYDVPSVAIQGFAPDGTIHFWNPASVRLYGYSELEAKGQNIFSLLFPAAVQEKLRASAVDMAQTGAAIPQEEFSLQTKDGETVYVSRSHVVLNPHNARCELFALDTDLTARRRAEEEREQLRSQLTQSQKLESIGRLAGGVAHEFNNMLSVIFGHVEIGQSYLDADSPAAESFAEIHKAAQRTADLTRQLLAYARKQIVSPKWVEMQGLIQNTVDMLGRLLGENIQIAWQPEGGTQLVKVDPAQMEQILTQLCLFARDAIGPKSGCIQIRSSRVDLLVPLANFYEPVPVGSYTCLELAYTASCAISSTRLEHVFEPFYGSEPQSGVNELGLATVYGMIRQNGAYANVNCTEDGHTTFALFWPRKAEERSGVPKPESASVAASGTGVHKVLLVEDESAILKLATIALQRAGYEVDCASSADAALELVSKMPDPVDLLITDVIMPGMNGRELAEKIREHCPNVICLFMSGYTADVIADHGVLDSEVHFLEKPFTMKKLVETTRYVLA